MAKKKYLTDEERKAAHRESNRKWRKNNPEYHKQYYQDNNEQMLEQMKQWRENNPDYRKQQYQDNKEKELEQMKQWRKDNKEYVAEYNKQWREDNPDYMKQWHEERYSTPIGRGNGLANSYKQNDNKHNRGECTITGEWMVDNVFNGQRCFYCKESDWTKLGVDRIYNDLPHTPDNVVVCCEECNTKRGRKSFEEFCKEMGVTIASEANF